MDAMTVDPAKIRHIAIVGTGVIGSGWAAWFAARGYKVTAFVRSASSEAKFEGFLQVAWRKVVARGLTQDSEGWKRVSCVRTIAECVGQADYVQESVVEELGLKQEIIEQIDACAPPHVFIGSSSSFIPLSMVRARARAHPDRVATVHPTLPQWDDFVEVMGSAVEHTAWLAAFFGREHAGMDVITLQREMHGHAHNCALNALITASTCLVKGGVTSAGDMDKAMCHLAKLVLAAGGVSGALVGCVGNGSEDAQAALSADILLGAPASVGACIVANTLPRPLAAVCLWCLRLLSGLYTGSALVKRLAKRYMQWMVGDFYMAWRDGPTGDEFEQRGLRRMRALSEASELQ